MRKYTPIERREVNQIPIAELDKQIMLGNWLSVYINDGVIIGCEEDEA